MKTLKIGVLGLGYWGPKIVRNFHDIEGVEVAMTCDAREARLSHIRSLYPSTICTRNYEDMLRSDIDAISIVTPVMTHYPLAKQALEAGKHVMIEKPITHLVEHARDLVRIANERGLTLMVGHTFQYNPAVLKARDVVQSGVIGDVYYIDSVRVNLGLFQPDINVAWDLAPHDISIVNHLLGQQPTAVSAWGESYVRPQSRLHEMCYIQLTYPAGIRAVLRVSWLDPVKTRRMTIVGSKKMLVYDDIADEKLYLYDKGTEFPPYSDTEKEFALSYRDNGAQPVPIEWSEPLRRQCEEFIRGVRTGEPTVTDGRNGMDVVRVLEGIELSLSRNGATVELRDV